MQYRQIKKKRVLSQIINIFKFEEFTIKKLLNRYVHESNVTLLATLFPTLIVRRTEYNIPLWDDENSPWEIFLKDSSNSLIEQIKSLKDEVIDFGHLDLTNIILDDAEGPIFIHKSVKIGEFVKIEGPCYIDKNVEIRHSAFIRKGSWICEGAVIGHSSEIKNSLLLPFSKAPHFNYVGDSILGFYVNIGAGVKLSNVRNDKRNILVTLKNGERENTGLRKLGALIGDNSEIGCNVVTNPGSIIGPNTMISPNICVQGWLD